MRNFHLSLEIPPAVPQISNVTHWTGSNMLPRHGEEQQNAQTVIRKARGAQLYNRSCDKLKYTELTT